MADDYRHGRYGRVKAGNNVIVYADKWSMEQTADASQFPTFGGGGFKHGVVGNVGATGTIEGPYDFDDPVEDELAVGSEYAAELYLSTVAGGDARFYTLTIQITGLSTTVDGTGADPVRWAATWQSDGTITDPS